MKQVNTTINGHKVTIIAVERGERVKQVRQDLGLEIGQYTSFNIQDDFDGDLAWGQPEMAKALKSAGVNLSNVVSVIEAEGWK